MIVIILTSRISHVILNITHHLTTPTLIPRHIKNISMSRCNLQVEEHNNNNEKERRKKKQTNEQIFKRQFTEHVTRR